MEALSPVLLGGLQVVPLVEYTGQAKMHFADDLEWLITRQLQDAPVGLRRRVELVIKLLYVSQSESRQYSGENIPGCMTERYGLSKLSAGCDAVSLEQVGIPQRPVRV